MEQLATERRVKVSFTATGHQVLDTNVPHTNEEAAGTFKRLMLDLLHDELSPPGVDWIKETNIAVDVTVVDA